MKKLSMLLLIIVAASVGCNPKKQSADNSFAADIVAVNSDYSTGSLSGITLSDFTVSDRFKGTVSPDCSVRSYNGLIYVINRTLSTIQVIDRTKRNPIIAEMSMGTSADPHDICVVSSTKAYVSRYGASEIWIVNPTTLVKTGSIDLSAYAPSEANGYSSAVANGIPLMDRIYFDSARSRIFVSVQRLTEGYNPIDYSSVIAIDTTTDVVKQEIKLTWTAGGTAVNATNPYSDFVAVPHSSWTPATDDTHDHIFISCVGFFGFSYKEDAGVVAIDPVDLHCETEYVIDESVIHSEVTAIALTGDNLYMVYSDSSYNNTVMKKSLSSKTTSSVYTTAGYYPAIIINPTGLLFLCDQTFTNPGIRVFDTANNDVQKFTNPLKTDLPPVDISVVQ
jgi:hypothetical protein